MGAAHEAGLRPVSTSHLASQARSGARRAHRAGAAPQYVTVTVIVSLYVPALGVVWFGTRP